MIKYLSNSVEQTEDFACKFSKELNAGDIIAFNGDLGAGKTAFVRGLAKGLQVYGEVSSPTYSLVNEYSGETPLYHFDMYRVCSMDDLYTTGFFDYLDMNGIMAIEWSENIQSALPENTIFITIEKLSENERKIIVDGGGKF
ncbi:MAG: hypothetical protein K0R90_554 [Oscillospiraceae bacterium]|jgi:tRNA threonylcarbamoyladenosine biosynthesis protein TsaE|nr:hypothetical protein [Oscillospiraceae bacterium]